MMQKGNDIPHIILGYSGHAYVVVEAALLCGLNIVGYAEKEELTKNPFNLKYLGYEMDRGFEYWEGNYSFLLGIGSNLIRNKVALHVSSFNKKCPVICHPMCSISPYTEIGEGTFVARNAAINPFCKLGKNLIINTSASIDHECIISDGTHIGPGAVLAGNVRIGNMSFVGANSVIKEGVVIGSNVVIGAGSVVINNIPDYSMAVGAPARVIKRFR